MSMDFPPTLSEELRRFADEAPGMRWPGVAFLTRVASEIPSGAQVLDVGAGDAPYRELFSHTHYRTCDWEQSQYEQANSADIRAPADQIPLGEGTIDAIINTQVLEHVPEPRRVLREFRRLLVPAGKVYITVPLVWYLHEEPHDYYRYTSHGLRYLLSAEGFTDIDIRPMNDAFATVSQLTSHLGYMMGRSDDGYDMQRDVVTKVMQHLSTLIGSFESMDTRWILPLSFSAVATRSNDLDTERAEAPTAQEYQALRMQTFALQERLDGQHKELMRVEKALEELRSIHSGP